MKLYVASSWRNSYQPAVVWDLRDAGHEVYDFRKPAPDSNGFSWSEIDPHWQKWTPERFVKNLSGEIAERGFRHDYEAMKNADACVLVLPCGRSAHLEAGWFTGKGKPLFVLMPPDGQEPELMYLLAGNPAAQMHSTFADLLLRLQELDDEMTGMDCRAYPH